EEHDRAYEAVLEARRRAKSVARAGLRIGDLYDAAGSAFIDFGFKDYLPGRIGHGLGVSLHEAPSLDRGSDMLLEEGMAITIEPGIVFPGWGSVRHSDSVIIRKDGIEVLSEYPEEKIVR
ncbi:MAG: M24 family metallopeptidase, partial [Pyramidobacter sp.]|nr:M24 family metallopeptidase [Pyramidobacter sp.]